MRGLFEEKGMEMMAAVVLAYLLVLLPISVMWSGFVLAKLWTWFVVPALGAAPLAVPSAIGLALIVKFMTHQDTGKSEGKDMTEVLIKGGVTLMLRPAVALGFGWVVAQWM